MNHVEIRSLPAPVLALAMGLAGGIVWTLLVTRTSPALALAALGGLVVVFLVIRRPAWGLLLTALVIPLERLGRFTDDGSMYTISLMRVVGVVALGSFLLHAAVRKWKLNFGVAFFLYAGYFGLAMLGISHTSDPLGSVRASGAILGNLMFFFLVTNLVREWRLARAAVALWLAATTLVGLYVIYDWHLGSGAIEESRIGETDTRLSTAWADASEWESLNRVQRAMGTTSHAAVYGINLVLTLPFFLYLMRTQNDRWIKNAALAALLVTLYNVMLTNTRAAILLAGLVLFLCAVRGLVRIRPSWVIAAALVGGLMLPLVPEAIYERVLDLSNYSYERSGTLRIRLEYWQAGLAVIEKNWLTGAGVGNQAEIPKYIKGYGPKQTTVHNEYIQTFLEVGLLGWLLFFSFVGVLMWRSFRAAALFRRLGEEERYWFLVACQIAMISVLLYGLQVDVFHFPLKGWWLVAALSWVMYQLAKQETYRNRLEVSGGIS